jgi:hypothetical protein
VTEAGLDRFQLLEVECPLALAATPPVADIGSALSITSWKGQAAAPCVIWLTSFDGTPLLFKLAYLVFDGQGNASLAGGIPSDPALHDRDIEFLALGIDQNGDIVFTNVAPLYIR